MCFLFLSVRDYIRGASAANAPRFADVEAVVDEEKTGLMEHRDEPPHYEEEVAKV